LGGFTQNTTEGETGKATIVSTVEEKKFKRPARVHERVKRK